MAFGVKKKRPGIFVHLFFVASADRTDARSAMII